MTKVQLIFVKKKKRFVYDTATLVYVSPVAACEVAATWTVTREA